MYDELHKISYADTVDKKAARKSRVPPKRPLGHERFQGEVLDYARLRSAWNDVAAHREPVADLDRCVRAKRLAEALSARTWAPTRVGARVDRGSPRVRR